MLELRIESNIKTVLGKYQKLNQKLNLKSANLAENFLTIHGSNYRLTAQDIIARDVYQAYSPKAYIRTNKLFMAPQLVMKSQNSFALLLDLSGLEADNPKTHSYYPRYVIAGVSRWNVPNYPARDFYYSLSGWLETFGGNFTSDFRKMILEKS